MQALSQLSYGPTMLRAGNHSDIDDTWEVVCAKSLLDRFASSGSSVARAFASIDECARRRLIDLDVVCTHECLIA